MTEVRLRERDHTYWALEGARWVRVPGVNEIVRAAVPMVTRFFTDEARHRGTRVHACLAQHLSPAGLAWDEIGPEIEPYVLQGIEALEIASARPVCVEEILYHAGLRFAGRPDFVGSLFGSETVSIVDHKTGSVPKIAGLTTAGYGLLAREHLTNLSPPMGYDFRRYALELTPKSHRFVPLHDTPEGHMDEARFLMCLHLYHAFPQGKEGTHVEPYGPDRD